MERFRPATARDDEGYLNAAAAARFISGSTSTGTLAQWRFHKRYPIPYIRIGRGKRGGRVYYRKADLIRFMESHAVRGSGTGSAALS